MVRRSRGELNDSDSDWSAKAAADSHPDLRNEEQHVYGERSTTTSNATTSNLPEDSSADDQSTNSPRINEASISDSNDQVDMVYILVHGNHGTPADWISTKAELYAKFKDTVLIFVSKSNSHSTHEGIDVGGRNLACEVVELLCQAIELGPRQTARAKYKNWKLKEMDESEAFDVKKSLQHSDELEKEKSEFLRAKRDVLLRFKKPFPITFIGHSLGGLYSRNCIGWLYFYGYFTSYIPEEIHSSDELFPPHDTKNEKKQEEEEEDEEDDIIVVEEKKEKRKGAPIIPVGLVTICSPHLGSRRPGGNINRATWRRMVHTVLNYRNGHTGIELLLEDHTNNTFNLSNARRQYRQRGGQPVLPMLVEMAHPDSIYLKGLKLFRTRTCVGVTHWDMLVPFCSACIVGHNPYPMPKSRVDFAVVGMSNFSRANNKIINEFRDRTAATSNPSLLATGEKESEDDEGIENPMGCSVVGISNKDKTTFTVDTTYEVEYYDSMIIHLHQDCPWRRLDIQFPKGLFVHELPIKKDRSKIVMAVCSNNPGLNFIKMLVSILNQDLEDFTREFHPEANANILLQENLTKSEKSENESDSENIVSNQKKEVEKPEELLTAAE